jgi:hypothetical protein
MRNRVIDRIARAMTRNITNTNSMTATIVTRPEFGSRSIVICSRRSFCQTTVWYSTTSVPSPATT